MADTETPKRGRGRPKKQERMRDYPIFTFAPDKETMDLIQQAADASGLSVSAWSRMVLTKAARQAKKELEGEG